MATPKRLTPRPRFSRRQLALVIAGCLIAGIAGIWYFVSHAASNPAADLNHDGQVNVLDMSTLLSSWGLTGSRPADINADSTVNILDLSTLLSSWGPVVAATPTPGAFQANCIVSPHVCGYPDATNTGVPAGTQLTNSGSITVTTNGAVIQNLNIVGGSITVRANNVTIKNTRITTCDYYPIRYFDDANTGLVVQDTEIAGTCGDVTASLSFDNYTAIRVNAHGGADGFKADANATIQDSYIHGLAVSDGSHNDGVQSTGGDNVTLRHNTFNVGDDGVCVQFGGTNKGWLVTNNLFNCGGWMLNGSAGTTNSTFTNNRFTRNAGYGPASITGTGITWTGNYYDNDNQPITDH